MYKSRYRHRLEVAIKRFVFRGRHNKGQRIESASELITALEARASSEKELRPLFRTMARLLSPPSCEHDHCELHTTYGYCNCAHDRAPSRCPEHRKYLKRRRERQAKKKGD